MPCSVCLFLQVLELVRWRQAGTGDHRSTVQGAGMVFSVVSTVSPWQLFELARLCRVCAPDRTSLSDLELAAR